MSAAWAALWTPGSSITIWFEPCLRISGSETPSLSTRRRMTSTDLSRSEEVSFWFFSGRASSTTSRPPWRSRPSVGFWCAGEPGIASSATPTTATRISPTRRSWERRVLTRRSRLPRFGVLARLGALFLEGRLGLLELCRLFLFLELLLVEVARDRGDRATVEAHHDIRGDLDLHHVFSERDHLAVQPAGGDDLVADDDRFLHGGVRALPSPLRHDDQEPEQDEQDQDQEVGHERRSRESDVKDSSLPPAIASRAPATRSSRKRKLCRLRRRRPRSSCWFTRCRMYARENWAQAGHPQPSSSGRGSLANLAFRRFRRPSHVSAEPVRAVRVGSTQSNMSTPAAITRRIPSGSPIPMK